jgi:hypothetical protein
MFHYTTTLYPDLSFLPTERRPKSLSLQQMFDDAQDIQHNIQACRQIQNEELDVEVNKSKYEQEVVDCNLEHKIENIIGPLEVSNACDRAKNYTTLVKRKCVALTSEPSHDKHGAGHFVDSQEDEFTKQFVEEQINIPSLFMLDDVAYGVDLPIYDEYKDDHDIENSLFQQYREEQNIRSAEEISLPLCFTTFRLLKENVEIIVEASEFVQMQNHTELTKQINKMLEYSFEMLGDPILGFEDDFVDSEIQSLTEEKDEGEHVQKPKEMEECTYDDTGKNEEGYESGNKALPLCFSSFALLKRNGVPNQKISKHEVESEESIGLIDKSSLPLCFSSFEWSRENYEISEKVGTSDYIYSGTVLHEKVVIIEEHQLHSHALHDHHLEGYFNSKFQSELNHQIKEEVDQEIFIEDLFLSRNFYQRPFPFP